MRLGGAGELVGGFPEPKAAQHGLGAHADVAMKEALQGSLGALGERHHLVDADQRAVVEEALDEGSREAGVGVEQGEPRREEGLDGGEGGLVGARPEHRALEFDARREDLREGRGLVGQPRDVVAEPCARSTGVERDADDVPCARERAREAATLRPHDARGARA